MVVRGLALTLQLEGLRWGFENIGRHGDAFPRVGLVGVGRERGAGRLWPQEIEESRLALRALPLGSPFEVPSTT